MRVSGGRTGAMVTMNRLSVKEPDDDSPLLPESVEALATTIVFHRQKLITTTDPGHFFLSRYCTSLQAPYTYNFSGASSVMLCRKLSCLLCLL